MSLVRKIPGRNADGDRSDGPEFGLPTVDLSERDVLPELLEQFPADRLFSERVLPLETNGHTVVVAVADPLNLRAIETLSAETGFFLEPVVAPADQIMQKLNQLLGVGGGTVGGLMALSSEAHDLFDAASSDLEDESQASAVVKLVNEILLEAVRQRASDVHIEPREEALDVRYRIDGVLREQSMPTEVHRFRSAIVSRLKIMAKLNIAERRLPQDGRMKLRLAEDDVDVRVSVIPMTHGEGVVMRLLNQSQTAVTLAAVEFPKELLGLWNNLIRRPHGMVLVTGPTGSGKTTTLYSSLAEVRSADTKIITVEDPVEYDLPGISQIQVQTPIGLTFAAGLRSVLRHDPDVVLIGEIRDQETAASAVQASLTGHLVLSTLHTNDAAGAFTRLVDMGVEPYLVASTVECVLAQRLVRRLCPHCREAVVFNREDLPIDFPVRSKHTLYRPGRCRECEQTGYRGRIALFELLRTDAEIRRLCAAMAPTSELRAYARSNEMKSLRQSGWQRVIDGLTSIEEVLRVCSNDDENEHT